MKQLRKASLLSLVALAFVCAGALGVARADVRDQRIISARAGGVNLVSGDVKVRRETSTDWLELSSSDELKSGDTVRTGQTGRVEVLLNPGSYFRAGGNTEFTLASADLDNLRVELARGSAVVEATGYGEMNIWLEVELPGGLVTSIVRSGVYRLNAPAGGPNEVVVAKGRALVGGTVVKGGKVARISNAGVEVTKLDKKLRDELDLWSRERGRELAKVNERLSYRALRTAFASRYDRMFDSWGNTNGFWFFDTGMRCYTFLPNGYGWRSPYGYGYGTGVSPTPNTNGGWTPGYNPGGGSAGSNPGGSNGSNPGGGSGGYGGSGGSGGGAESPRMPTNITPPTRSEPSERPMRERTIEPGARPN